MPYFMEFSTAVGMHAGYLPGYPASHGCVRMPRDLAVLFFERVQIGEVLQLYSHPEIGWLDASPGIFGLRFIQVPAI
jgi:L,D-transpeptidase catalytic domain